VVEPLSVPALSQPDAPRSVPLLSDTYDDDRALGSVLGTASTSGAPRGGVDVEGRLAIDNAALRMRPLQRPGWGREGIAYGPVPRRPGTVASMQVLNGHHSSQTFYMPETPRQLTRRWLATLARGRWPGRPRHHENLAVGLFDSPAPRDPITDGHGVVVHASTVDNGELWAAVCGRPLQVLTGLQDLPLVVTVVLREQGAVYYAATTPGDPDLPSLPRLRPLAVDPFGVHPDMHPGAHQRILGEVGYRIDTRIYRTDVAVCPELSAWCTTAVVADRLTGTGSLTGSEAERGGYWQTSGQVLREQQGAAGDGRAVLDAGQPVGLVHALVRTARGGHVEVVLRAVGPTGPAWRLRVGTDGAALLVDDGRGAEAVARSSSLRLRPGRQHSLQILDSGDTLSAYLDGRMLFDRWISDARRAQATWTGFAVGGGARLSAFEAHPRTVPAPLAADPAWTAVPEATEVRLHERFDDTPGPLDGRVTSSGGRRWERVEGVGHLDLVPGGGARVRATPDEPNPGRTVYAVPWDWPYDADVRLTMLPPGTARGQRHNGRGGLILWQDPQNYLVVNVWLDDWLNSTSVSTFYRVRGHEDMYDAVWTLTGDRITWGVPFELRVAFDGERFTASVDGRPTLYRAVRDVYPDAPRLAIRRIGVVANEEWGDDTGTTFTSLRAGTRAPRPEEFR
jgi:hypothetical protein